MKFILALCSMLLVGSPAHAQDMPLATVTGSAIGLIVSDYHYEEDNNGSFFMSLEGRKFGIDVAITQALPDDWYWGLDYRYVAGNVDYKSAGSGEKSANRDDYSEIRLTAGKDWQVARQILSPYAGLAYRYLSNDLRGFTSTGAIGYRRTSAYIYMPVGIQHRIRAASTARWVTTLEYDYLVQGTQRSYMTDVVGGAQTYTSDLINLQRSGHGWRLQLAYETRDWSIAAFHHLWDIATSDRGVYTSTSLVHTAVEPHNITQETGILLRRHFH